MVMAIRTATMTLRASKPTRRIGVAALAVVLTGLLATAGYGLTHQAAPVVAATRTATIAKGTITQSVAVAGSLSSSVTVKLNPAVDGKVAQLFVTVGQQISPGQPLAAMDTVALQAALTTAQNNLAAAQTNYDKAVAGVTDAQTAFAQAQQSAANNIATAQAALAKLKANYAAAESSYANLSLSVKPDVQSFTSAIDGIRIQLKQTISDMNQRATPDVQAAVNALNSADTTLVNGQAYANGQLASALADFATAQGAVGAGIAAFDAALAAGHDPSVASTAFQTALSVYTGTTTRLTTALGAPTSALSSAQGNVSAAQQNINTSQSRADGYLDQARADFVGLQSQLTSEAQLASALSSRMTQIASAITTLNDAISGSYATAVQNVAQAQLNAAQSIQSAQTAVNNQPANVQSAQNTLGNAQTAAATAQSNLDNAVIKATIAGTVTTISAQVGENALAASATGFIVIANTSSLVLHGTIGEGDVSKLALGQTAAVTIDAVGAARLTGKITSVDPVATIASGVPVYGVDVTLDTANAAIRPGMSGTANVVIASAQGVLIAPNLAVKTKGGQSYVTISKGGQQTDTTVTVGLSDGTSTELKSGVALGDTVVITSSTRTTTTTTGGGGGGGIRIPGIGGGG
jgi:multidrug efflux pump subunit AcrA (membrane-fusion protein)